jgi:hypothetical protein
VQCRFPPSTGSCVVDPEVKKLEAEFKFAVTEAQIEADKNGFVLNGRVQSPEIYTAEVARILRANGYCAVGDKDEVLVKNTNVFSEHYDLVIGGSNEVWQRMVAKCSPAFF